ncbi:MAG: (deoxy)nucleoside triphosphate pyrophosphohydrolase [Myxococcota bacterium]|jgi:8-oxo-dGTP diphosphatase|nr:(deoxy)nucleoside triphosphate pyrophosphohydrolase [Myxococcota bacterium]
MQFKPRVKVVAGVLEVDGAVLVQERPAGKARAFLWEFPGGKVDPGESSDACVEREFFEELGLRIRVDKELWSHQHAYEDIVVDLTLFAVTHLSSLDEMMAHDGQTIAWVQKTELMALDFCPADKEFIAFLAKA